VLASDYTSEKQLPLAYNSTMRRLMTGKDDSSGNHQEEPITGNENDAAAERLIRQVDRYLGLLHITHEAILCVDEQCHIAVFNQGAEKLFGYSRNEIIGQPLMKLICPHFRSQQKHRLAALTRIARESRLGFKTDKVICQRKNGDRFPTEASLSQSALPGHRFYTLVVRDNSAHLAQQRRLAYQAEHDDLTDLPNRTLLNDRLGAGIARADRNHRKLGVVYLDLDDFKPINDHYGHDTGDCLLQALARRLNDTMRQTDTVSRIGGDEFIVCVEQIKGEQDAIAAAAKIVYALKQPFQILGQEIKTSASIGIAMYPDHGKDPATLLRHADQAMYAAKAAGRSPIIYRGPSGD
jgi:diguanylate cyclase (GGDEF)-like protein/PAS domain S-box-containing protein